MIANSPTGTDTDRREDASATIATPFPLREPKRLYRVLDGMLTSGAGGGDPERLLAGCLDELFEPLRHELGVEAAALYVECERQFVLSHRVGPIPTGLAVSFASDHPLARTLVERHTIVHPDPAAPGSPASQGIAPPSACAVTLLAGAGARHVLLLLLASPCDRAATDAVLNTLRTALTARMLQDRWRRSLRTAAEIQRGLLPDHVPPLSGYDVAGRSITAEEVGGDFYDFYTRSPESVGLVVGDASGHGLPAALIARDAVVGLRVAIDREMRISEAFSRLNRVIHAGVAFSSFVSVVYVEVEPDGQVVYVNAGHPPPICVTRHESAPLALGGTAIGPVRDARYRARTSHLEPGSLLLAYTDGVVERRNPRGEFFGEDRLVQVAQAQIDAPAERIVEAVFAVADAFGGHAPWDDDATLVVMKRLARP
jgi:sigma-B regulation protein RsbU (phosphoserine phosphatase)